MASGFADGLDGGLLYVCVTGTQKACLDGGDGCNLKSTYIYAYILIAVIPQFATACEIAVV